MSKAVVGTKKIIVNLPGISPYDIEINPQMSLCSLLNNQLNNLSTTVGYTPYVKLGTQIINLMISSNFYYDNDIRQLIPDKPLNKCVLQGKRVYDNITEIGVYSF